MVVLHVGTPQLPVPASRRRADGAAPLHRLTLDHLVNVVRSTGGIGVVAVYVPEDPGLDDPQMADRVAWQYGTFFSKGQSMGKAGGLDESFRLAVR